MIGSSVLGDFVFLIYDSMFSAAFDVLIKILKSYRHQNPSVGPYISLVNKSIDPITPAIRSIILV